MRYLIKLSLYGFLVATFCSIGSKNCEAQITWNNLPDFNNQEFWHVSNQWTSGGGLTVPSATTSVIFETAVGSPRNPLVADSSTAAQNSALNITFNGSSGYTISPFGTPTLSVFGTVTNSSTATQVFSVNTAFQGARTIQNTAAGQTTFSGNVTSTGNLTVSKAAAGGTGAVLFSNTGSVNVGANTLISSNNNAVGAITFNGAVTAAAVSNTGSGVTNYGAIASTSITNSGTGQVNVAGTVTSSGALSITKSNTGSIVFGGAVNAGANSISVSNTGASGTVAFNGTVTASSVSVSGNRLEGTGTINAGTTIQGSGSYSAGQTGVANGIGTQTFNTGALAFANNSSFVWDLNNSAVPGADAFDRIIANAGLSFGTGFTTQINLNGASVVAGDFWDVFTSNTAITGNLLGSAISIASGSNPNNVFFQWSLESGNTIGRITAVPEPSSMALLGMAGLIGGVYARRRAKKNKA